MTPTELYDLFRSDVSDVARPYLWSDTEVYAYMNDAYSMYFRLIGGIGDSTSDVTQIDAVAGEPYADIHPSILYIRHAHRMSDGRELKRMNFEDLGTLTEYDYGIAAPMRITDEPGAISGIIIGMEPNKVRWLKVPEVDDTVQLYVYRLPLNTLTPDSTSFPDLEERHHIHLLKGMKYHAYNKQDTETFNKEKALLNYREFVEYCTQAKREWDRMRHKPRAVVYGGL